MNLKKIKKLIFHPILFIKDALWFKNENINISDNYDTLFIISHLGQLQKAEMFIKYKKNSNCIIVILYTKKNLEIPNSIIKNLDNNLVKDYFLLLLPNYPNNLKLKSLVYMNRNYKNLIAKVKPKEIILFSFENHYSLLINFTREKYIKTILIEEGTATYKTPEKSEYYLEKSYLKYIFAKFLKIHYAFSWTIDFDEVYGTYPDVLSQTFKRSKCYYFFPYEFETDNLGLVDDIIDKYKITNNDFIYINQRYAIDYRDFSNILIKILFLLLKKNKNTKIFIKLHPKDSVNLKKYLELTLYNSNDIILIKESEFAIESVIKKVKPKVVIGLTSSVLVYVRKISPTTIPYSITPLFLSYLKKKNKYYDAIYLINNHFNIIKKFKFIKESI